MDAKRLVRSSKYLARHLRHDPGRLGLQLQPGGWVDVDELLKALQRQRFALTRAELEYVVEHNDKRRFGFDDTGRRIRANHGHSVPIELHAEPAAPPDVLLHGTSTAALHSIRRDGLKPMGRRYVHLCDDHETAVQVGRRHGRPIVLRVDARRMAADHHTFFRSDSGVWLVDAVAPAYLAAPDDPAARPR